MELFDKLSEEDINQLWCYLKYYGGDEVIPAERMRYFLRYWNSNKESFFQMFNNQFIIKKPIYFSQPQSELEYLMEDEICCTSNTIIQKFCFQFKQRLYELLKNDDAFELGRFVNDASLLVENQYYGSSFTIPAEATINGRAFQINSGCKVVKTVGKVCKAIGFSIQAKKCKHCGRLHDITAGNTCDSCGEKTKIVDGYEEFRRAHSLVLNQKKIKGNLCLSIHPLDFLTMSDNDCGWSSCMSWMEEPGDYRLGTIEMMNSPYVVIAYLEASEPMYVCTKNWNNKRWRQLYIVTPELILGNRQYPYDSDVLQGTAIKWLRDLCSNTVGWGPYEEETSWIYNNKYNYINNATIKVYFSLSMCFMYNDIYDHRLAYVAAQGWEDQDDYSLNVSGPAVCTACGDEIEYQSVEADCVNCASCSGYWTCWECGDRFHGYDDEAYYVGDRAYCQWCYNDLPRCECCNDTTDHEDSTSIYLQFVFSKSEELKRLFDYSYYVPLCNWCLYYDNRKEYEKLFGPIYDSVDDFGVHRKVFDIMQITEEGLHKGHLSNDTIDFLRKIKSLDSDEERLTLMREFAA